MPFDLKAKENLPLVEHLKTKRAVVVDMTSSTRRAIRRMFSVFGISNANTDAFEKYGEALASIKKNRPQIIISDYVLDQENGLKLFDILKSCYPNSLDRTFILIAANKSKAMAGIAAEAEVDALLVRPFSPQDVEDKFLELTQAKCNPSHYCRAVEQGRIAIEKNDLVSAQKIFEGAKNIEQKSTQAIYYLGQISEKQQDVDSAEKHYCDSLQIDPDHLRSLEALLHLKTAKKDFKGAFEVGSKIVKGNAVNPKILSTLVKVAIHNGSYEAVAKYCDIFNDIADMDDATAMHISAGMVVCAKNFIKLGKRDQAIKYLNMVEKVCRGKVAIMIETIAALIRLGATDEAKRILARSSDDVQNAVEIKIAELEFVNSKEGASPGEVVQMADTLVRTGMKHPRIFELLLARSIEIKRKASSIKQIVDIACLEFPDKADLFRQYLPEDPNAGNIAS